MKRYFATGLIFITLVASSCRKDSEPALKPVFKPTPFELEIPYGFPKNLNIPKDNPLTVEGIELGRYLFYDGRVSGRTDPDSLMSCSSCHIQEHAFECGIDNPKYMGGRTYGLTGIVTPHYMVPVFNLVWNHNGYLWNGLVAEDNPVSWQRNIEALA